MTRVQQLNEAVDRLSQAQRKWANDAKSDNNPPGYMCEAIEETLTIFDAGPCPVSHIPLSNAVAQFREAFDGWEENSSEWVTKGEPSPQWFRRLTAIFDARKVLDVTVGPPKSVATAREHGASDEQIAKVLYGFLTSDGVTYDPDGNRYAGPLLTPNGHVDSDKLAKEAKEPGSVVPAGWINPRDREELRKAGHFDTMQAAEIPGAKPVDQEAGKGIALKLLRDGGTLPQIQQLSGLSATQIEAIADEFDIPMPFDGDDENKETDDALNAAILEELAKDTKPNQIVNKLRGRFGSRINLGVVNAVKKSR